MTKQVATESPEHGKILVCLDAAIMGNGSLKNFTQEEVFALVNYMSMDRDEANKARFAEAYDNIIDHFFPGMQRITAAEASNTKRNKETDSVETEHKHLRYSITKERGKDPVIKVCALYWSRKPGVSYELFERTFTIGDECESGSYNLIYTDPIVSIGKRIGIQDHNKVKRMSIAEFCRRNFSYDRPSDR